MSNKEFIGAAFKRGLARIVIAVVLCGGAMAFAALIPKLVALWILLIASVIALIFLVGLPP